MKKIYGFMAIFLTVFMLAFSPAPKVQAGACDTVCLLQMGNSQVQNLGSQLQEILAAIQKKIMGWLEDAKAWLSKYAQKAWSSLGLDDMEKYQIPDPDVPNLAGKGTGIKPGKSYQISGSNPAGGGSMNSQEAAAAIQNKTVNSGTAAMATGKIDKIAEAKQAELLSPSGTFEASQYESEKKLYIAQQDAIDALAKALVAKNTLPKLKTTGDDLDTLFAAIQGSSATKPEASYMKKSLQATSGFISGAIDNLLDFSSTNAEQMQHMEDSINYAMNRDLYTAMKNNLRVRLLLDKLLTMKQQLLAFRVKNAAGRGIREMEPVAKISPIEIILPQELPKPTDKIQTPGK